MVSYIIYVLSDDSKGIEVRKTSKSKDYNEFLKDLPEVSHTLRNLMEGVSDKFSRSERVPLGSLRLSLRDRRRESQRNRVLFLVCTLAPKTWGAKSKHHFYRSPDGADTTQKILHQKSTNTLLKIMPNIGIMTGGANHDEISYETGEVFKSVMICIQRLTSCFQLPRRCLYIRPL
jgi:hypothetical protein